MPLLYSQPFYFVETTATVRFVNGLRFESASMLRHIGFLLPILNGGDWKSNVSGVTAITNPMTLLAEKLAEKLAENQRMGRTINLERIYFKLPINNHYDSCWPGRGPLTLKGMVSRVEWKGVYACTLFRKLLVTIARAKGSTIEVTVEMVTFDINSLCNCRSCFPTPTPSDKLRLATYFRGLLQKGLERDLSGGYTHKNIVLES
jgi:hypothetical protein